MEEVAKRVEVDGIQAWWDLDSRDILGADADNYEKVPDTPGRVVRLRVYPLLRG